MFWVKKTNLNVLLISLSFTMTGGLYKMLHEEKIFFEIIFNEPAYTPFMDSFCRLIYLIIKGR
jgi:hypothetical protein